MMLIARRGTAVLRHAEPADQRRIDEIAIACWSPIHASFEALMGPVMYAAVTNRDGQWRQRKTQQIRDHFARTPDCVWVVEDGGQVLAFVTFRLDGDRQVGEIGNNGVHPDFAGHGWGTFMYRHVLRRFREVGLKYALVGTGLDEGHAPARRAYEAVGFDRSVPKVEYWQELDQHNPGSEPPAEEVAP